MIYFAVFVLLWTIIEKIIVPLSRNLSIKWEETL